MRDFWRTHQWPAGERRYHWLVVFDDQPAVARCHAAHTPVLADFRGLADPVPTQWLHLTMQSLCATTEVDQAALDRLLAAVRARLAVLPPARVQLGPARPDGGAVTWAVYPEDGLAAVQAELRKVSIEVLGEQRVARQRGRWWPHVTLAYGAVDAPADDLAGALARAGLPRADITVDSVRLVDQEQDLTRREFRWRELASVPLQS